MRRGLDSRRTEDGKREGETSEIGDDRVVGSLKMIVAVKYGAETLWRSGISRV